ncbi:MAG TPA: lysylphosphatidylglycerol synthase transmembrane domain-containing protein [Actinomycetes bacterium]|nr:lysylphosphatidylglycerol synthase transmembrane domain-containing protein [Actinomycetes bacterium]
MTVQEHARVEVVEPPLAQRVRRPADALRFAVALVALVLTLVLGTIAHGTATGVETDVVQAVSLVPAVVLFLLNLITGVGLLGLPIAVSLDLLVRRRPRQLIDAMAGTAFAAVVVVALNTGIVHVDRLSQLRFALSVGVASGTLSSPLSVLLASTVAFLVVARVGERRGLLPLSVVVVGASVATTLLAGRATLLSVAAGILLGLTIGFAARVVLGTVPSRPSGREIAAVLAGSLPDLVRLERIPSRPEDGRRYAGSRAGGAPVDVVVLDRDLEGAGLAYRLWRLLLVRGPAAGRTLVSVQQTLERDALMTYALAAAGVGTPRLLAVSEVGPSAVMLAYEHRDARALADLEPGEVDQALLESIWEELAALRRANLAHRELTAENIWVTPGRAILLTGMRGGEVAATDLHQRLDVAQLLTTLALVAGPRAAVGAGAAVLGPDALATALPVLQSLVLARSTRQALRRQRGLLEEVREAVMAVAPAETTGVAPDTSVERLTWRRLLLVVGGAVAAYVLLSQLSDVDLIGLLRRADWPWVVVLVACSALTYIGAAFSLNGFVLERIPLPRTLLAQLASSFVSLVAPPAVGSPAVNARFLQRQGLEGPVALATIGVWQAMSFVVHLVLLVTVGVLAGTQAHTSFDPPEGAVVGAAVLLLVAGGFLSLPWARRTIGSRLTTLGRQVIPHLLAVAQRPGKLAEGIGGSVFLNIAYCAALVASVRAFGGDLPWPAISVVYLAGAAVGSAAPTPGGLGAVETALAAGLTAAGMEGGAAVSSVLLFRLATYWLPVAPGWAAFRWLQAKGSL